MKCDVYNSFLFRFNNIFILSHYLCCFFRILYFFFFISFDYLPCLSTSINKKIITIVTNLKQKFLSQLIFFESLEAVILSFSHSSFKALPINSLVSRNVFLTAFKTTKVIFILFLSILTTRACSLIFYFSALCFKKYLKLFYTHS